VGWQDPQPCVGANQITNLMAERTLPSRSHLLLHTCLYKQCSWHKQPDVALLIM
jgi:hypothetical protein